MPSPAMVVALVALFFAMSGLGIAAKMITGKQIENGTVTSKDLAKGAVKAKNLGPGSVTSMAIDPTHSPDLSQRQRRAGGYVGTVCSNGMIVYNTPCPSIPELSQSRYAKAENFADFEPISIPGPDPCAASGPIPLSSISFYPDYAPVGLDPTGDFLPIIKKLTDVFTASARGVWEEGAGSLRIISIHKRIVSGPNAGETITLAHALDVPSADRGITQSTTVNFAANNREQIFFEAWQCGEETVDLERLDVSVVPLANQG